MGGPIDIKSDVSRSFMTRTVTYWLVTVGVLSIHLVVVFFSDITMSQISYEICLIGVIR